MSWQTGSPLTHYLEEPIDFRIYTWRTIHRFWQNHKITMVMHSGIAHCPNNPSHWSILLFFSSALTPAMLFLLPSVFSGFLQWAAVPGQILLLSEKHLPSSVAFPGLIVHFTENEWTLLWRCQCSLSPAEGHLDCFQVSAIVIKVEWMSVCRVFALT